MAVIIEEIIEESMGEVYKKMKEVSHQGNINVVEEHQNALLEEALAELAPMPSKEAVKHGSESPPSEEALDIISKETLQAMKGSSVEPLEKNSLITATEAFLGTEERRRQRQSIDKQSKENPNVFERAER